MGRLIGRKEYIDELEDIYKSNKSEFVAVYGRRRIGKTFLIDSVFESRMTFSLTAMANSTLKSQLLNFKIEMSRQFNRDFATSDNWLTALNQLATQIESLGNNAKKVLFFDEMPWLDTPKSDFLSAFEHFWNGWASKRDDIMLIACGSATSWIVNKLINNKGGLHNRVTHRIRVMPLPLADCNKILEQKEITCEKNDVISYYMALGGVPYYWTLIKKGLSVSQNIDYLFFNDISPLKDEFKLMYSSLFAHHEKYIKIIEILGTKAKGLTRKEIIEQSSQNSGGGLSVILNDLELCGFIKKNYPPDTIAKNVLYQLTDFYTLFYLHFLKNSHYAGNGAWSKMVNTPKLNTWAGLAFEQVCFANSQQILETLKIAGIKTSIYPWKSRTTLGGAQIDMVIDRADNVVNICEIKFSTEKYIITADYADNIRNKAAIFRQETGTKKTIFLTMITTLGIVANKYSGMIQNQVVAEDLF
ncbi:MAG: ATP-binding protein [Bacteroidales bacterium]|nr:ATP-binding protein [Bacteroidales bacterium]